MTPHPDMIEDTAPRPRRALRTRKPAPAALPGEPAKNPPRPILGKRTLRGLRRLLAGIAPGAYLHDPELTAAVRYLSAYIRWHEHPGVTAKRKARGQAIKAHGARAKTPET
ncbi:MAG: hypothetical protein KBG29_07855 [Pseudomonadales bacterium]|nr:hypothetical protein [Pseudomonadales bacterium]